MNFLKLLPAGGGLMGLATIILHSAQGIEAWQILLVILVVAPIFIVTKAILIYLDSKICDSMAKNGISEFSRDNLYIKRDPTLQPSKTKKHKKPKSPQTKPYKKHSLCQK